MSSQILHVCSLHVAVMLVCDGNPRVSGVALYLVSRLRRTGMDAAKKAQHASMRRVMTGSARRSLPRHGYGEHEEVEDADRKKAELEEASIALQKTDSVDLGGPVERSSEELAEPPGNAARSIFEIRWHLFVAFAGNRHRIHRPDPGREGGCRGQRAVFVHLFHGFLCVFLLEMGMTASSKLKDLRRAGWQFVTFALVRAPNVFATGGMLVALLWIQHVPRATVRHQEPMFSLVFCAEPRRISRFPRGLNGWRFPRPARPLPLAASLGVTFSYNVTIGIPVYIMIATILKQSIPIL